MSGTSEQSDRDAYRYAAMISYRHVNPDRRWAKWLHRALEAYRVPTHLCETHRCPRRIGRVFRDEEELAASSDLSANIDEALRQSRFLIIVCSPRVVQSRWVDEEIRRFRVLGGNDRILALLIEGEPNEAFPPAIRELGRNSSPTSATIEPLAADVRPVSGERSTYLRQMAKLRILAAILVVNFDDLRLRERERQHRRLAWATAAATLLLAVMTALAGIALWQRQIAVRERQRTEARFQEVRELANRFLFAFHDSIAALPGSSPARKLCTETAEKYLQVLANENTDDLQLLHELWASYVKLGDIVGNPYSEFGNMGDVRLALRHFQTSLRIAQRLVSQNPGNAILQRDMSISYGKIGDVLRAHGDLSGSLQSYRAGLEISQRLASQDPNNAKWQQDLSVTYDKIGDVLMAQGDLSGAWQSYRAGFEIFQRGVPGLDQFADWQRNMSITYDRIGDVLMAQGNLSGSLQSYRAGLEICQRLASQDPNNTDWQRNLSISYDKIGDVLKAQGDLSGSFQSYRAGLEICQRLASQDPNNADCQRDLSVSYGQIGDVLMSQGNLSGALQAYNAGLEIAQRLASQDPSNIGWQRDMAASWYKLWKLHEQLGNMPESQEAAKAYHQVLSTMKKSGIHLGSDANDVLVELDKMFGEEQ